MLVSIGKMAVKSEILLVTFSGQKPLWEEAFESWSLDG